MINIRALKTQILITGKSTRLTFFPHPPKPIFEEARASLGPIESVPLDVHPDLKTKHLWPRVNGVREVDVGVGRITAISTKAKFPGLVDIIKAMQEL